ncbi:MAG: lipoprotein [Anaerocolumna aminovalerica]|uniref:lipoprotein n=1 Tax=Anaerocolumna aminovalerica TaxID=1527 RepID=UPI0029107900|nr:lipoprotein [Anaerocolumna aminovalerica]MDU6263794.1 lipoprotein [Anaerocolumna aminovalerica]
MKKILLCIGLLLLLTGCNNKVDKNEYDDLKIQFDNLKSDYDSLESTNKELKSKYDELTEENKTLQSKLAENTMEKYDVSTSIVAEAWGNAAFGDSTECFQKNKYITEYEANIGEATDESLETFFKQLNENMGTLALITSTEEIKQVIIKAIDSNSNPIFELYLDSSENENAETQMLINVDYIDIVKRSLVNAY